jgi:protein involved in temperature-dependent protein secretion
MVKLGEMLSEDTLSELKRSVLKEVREHPAIKSIRTAHEGLARAIGQYERAQSQLGPLRRKIKSIDRLLNDLKRASKMTVQQLFRELDALDPKEFPGWR